jgi:hypothetical protein
MGVNDHRGVLTAEYFKYILKHDDVDTASNNRLMRNPDASTATFSREDQRVQRGRVLRLTLLTPEIVEAYSEWTAPAGCSWIACCGGFRWVEGATSEVPQLRPIIRLASSIAERAIPMAAP